jgi:hypothetical protein
LPNVLVTTISAMKIRLRSLRPAAPMETKRG